MTPALDAGHVLATRAVDIGPRETAADLERRLADLGAGAVLDAIERLQAAVAAGARPQDVGLPQDATRATRAPRLTKTDGIVDWSQPAVRIERLRRAVEPWPRATTFLHRGDGQRQRLVLEDVTVASVASPRAEGPPVPEPGAVLEAAGDRIVVACGEGTALEIRRLVPEGRRSMSAAEFLRGSPLLPGMRLG